MPLKIVRKNIENMQVDAIVNTTNSMPCVGPGVDAAIHEKAGPELLAARMRIGTIPVSSASATPGYGLNAAYVIHTVCPVWQGGIMGEQELLEQCYIRCLELALRRQCRSVAFPVMGAGSLGFPQGIAVDTAMTAIRQFLRSHEMEVYLVTREKNIWTLSEKRFEELTGFVDRLYVRQENPDMRSWNRDCLYDRNRHTRQKEIHLRRMEEQRCQEAEAQVRREEWERTFRNFRRVEMEDPLGAFPEMDKEFGFEKIAVESAAPADACVAEEYCVQEKPPRMAEAPRRKRRGLEFSRPGGKKRSTYDAASAPRQEAALPEAAATPDMAYSISGLRGILEQTDAGFSETLLKLIDQTGKKDSEIYSRANVSRQHFSKIRNNPDYKPTKQTAIAFAIALELDLEQTRDLIGRAGYALTRSSKFDLIIMYFIREGNYNLFDINAALFDFDQSLLGA